MELLIAIVLSFLAIVIWSAIGGVVVFWLDRKYYGGTHDRAGRLVEWVDSAPANGSILALWAWPLLIIEALKGNRKW